MSDTEPSLRVLVSGRYNGGELTSWPPAFRLLMYLIVVLTIYRIRMGLSLRHCEIDVHMSGLRKRSLSLGSFGLTVGMLLATVSVLLLYRAEAKVAAILYKGSVSHSHISKLRA